MARVSTARLYVMRAMYLLMVVGLALDQWPRLLARGRAWELWHGVGSSLLCAICLMAVLGLRYPLKMLPLLLFELAWKVIWVGTVGVPLWMTHQLTDPFRETLFNCLLGVVLVPIAVPWSYVWAEYVVAPGTRWRGERLAGATSGTGK